MFENLDSGTDHHNFMHRCNNKIKRIKELTKHIDVHGILDDWREEIEEYVMKNIKGNTV